MINGVRRVLFGVMLLIPACGLAADDWRTFTDTSGRTLVARVLKHDDTSVTFETKADRRQVTVKLNELTPADVLLIGLTKNQAEIPNPATPDNPPTTTAPQPESTDALYPRTKKEIDAGIHEISKRPKPGDLSREVHEATKRLNIYRFLCGVPHEVTGDPQFSKNAEDAAMACKRNGGLSHSLGHSTDKCNLSSNGNIIATVSGYMEDGGDNNREARGHRAWCLNPRMGKVGFGSAGDRYSAMWCMDGSGKSIQGTWAYPGKGFFPIEYLHGNAWSVYGLRHPPNVKIELFKLSRRPDRTLPATGDISGRVIKVNHVSFGMNAINFEPAEAARRGIYWVRISGDGLSDGYLVELY